MTKYREILRLSGLGLSQQNIADSCNVSKKTVNRVLKRAKELDISLPLDESDTDAVLAEKFFPSANQVTSNKRMPDYDYIQFSYRITAKLQLFTTADGKTSRSMRPIRNWLSIMARLLFRRVSGLPRISLMLKER